MILKPPLFAKPIHGHPLGPDGGLVGCWPMNEGRYNSTFNKVYDLSGNGNHGSFVNTPIWTSGDSGSSLDFEAGDTDYVNCGTDFDITTAFTLIAKIKPESIAGYPTVASIWELEDKDERQLKLVSTLGGNNPYVDISSNGTNDIYRQGTSALVAGEWVTIAGVYDGSSLHFYKNGVLDDGALTGVVPVTLHQSGQSFAIGTSGGGGGSSSNPFDGVIEYVYFFARAFTAFEIALLYREPFCMFERDPIELWSAATLGVAVEGNAGIMTPNTGFWGPTF